MQAEIKNNKLVIQSEPNDVKEAAFLGKLEGLLVGNLTYPDFRDRKV